MSVKEGVMVVRRCGWVAVAASTVLWMFVTAAPAFAQASASPFTTGYRFDMGGRVTGIIDPDPDDTGPLTFLATRNTYNAQGLLTKIEQGRLSTWQSEAVAPASWTGFTVSQTEDQTYDIWGNVTRSTTSSGGVNHTLTQMSYDVFLRPECTAVRMAPTATPPGSACTLGTGGPDGANRVTRNQYDNLDRVTQVTRAVGTANEQIYARYQYSGNGNRISITDANGNRSDQAFDGFDRLERLTLPSATTPGQVNSADFETYSYDNNGNRIDVRRRSNQVVSYTFDALNRMTAINRPGTSIDVAFGYDLRGLQTSATFQTTGLGVSNGFDGFGRKSTSTVNLNSVTRTLSYEYDANSNLTTITHPDGIVIGYEYDGLDRMTRILENGTTGVLDFVYNSDARRSQITRGSGGATTYSYDEIGRLDLLVQNLTGTSNDITLAFTHTPANQMREQTVTATNANYEYGVGPTGTTNYNANGLNQYTSATGSTFSYDTRGNLTSDGATTFTYDVENRLTSATGARSGTLTYDPLGRLHQLVAGGATTRFLYDGDALVAEYDTSGALLRRYVHGPDIDEPVLWYEGSSVSSAARRYLRADHHGSIIAASNASAGLVGINAYDPYGQPSSWTETTAGRFAYTGQMMLPGLQLYHYRARAYDPVLGRFLQTDPIWYADDLNLYADVGNDPLNNTDPTGACIPGWQSFCDLDSTKGCVDACILEGIVVVAVAYAAYQFGQWLMDWYGSASDSNSSPPPPAPNQSQTQNTATGMPDPDGWEPNDPYKNALTAQERQMVAAQIRANPGAGQRIIAPSRIGDARYSGGNWEKMQIRVNVRGVDNNFHYMWNRTTGHVEQIKLTPMRGSLVTPG